MFRTHRAIVHRDRTFSEPLTGRYVYNGRAHGYTRARACIGDFVSRRVFSHNFSTETFRYLRPHARNLGVISQHIRIRDLRILRTRRIKLDARCM